MRVFAAVCAVLFGLSAGASAVPFETWTNVPLVDSMCSRKVQKDPDTHPRDCAVKCAESGFGILAEGGAFLKLDKAGTEKVLAALKASEKKDHLRVTVTGDRSGETLTVKTIELLK